MVLYVCEKCNKEFGRKSNYLTHINKKFSCNKNLAHNIEIAPKSTKKAPKSTEKTEKTENPENTYTSFCCSFCNKKYSSKYTLSRHMNSCKIKRESDIEKENIFKLLSVIDKLKNKEIEIDELKKQNKILMDKLISLEKKSKSKKTINNKTIINNNQTNNNQTNNNQTNNIVMVNFGKEDLSIIDKEIFFDRVVKNRLYGVKVPEEICIDTSY